MEMVRASSSRLSPPWLLILHHGAPLTTPRPIHGTGKSLDQGFPSRTLRGSVVPISLLSDLLQASSAIEHPTPTQRRKHRFANTRPNTDKSSKPMSEKRTQLIKWEAV